MNGFLQFIKALFVGCFRLAAGLVVAAVLIFPAFKGVWLGYVPVILGAVLGYVFWRHHGWLRRRFATGCEARFLIGVSVVILLLLMALISVFRSLPTYDGLFVYQQAVEWSETGEIDPITYYAPGQIWYYGLAFRLLGASPRLAQLVQIPLVLAILWVAYGIVRQAAGRVTACMVFLAVAVYPSMLLYILVTPYYFYLYTLMILLIVWAWFCVDHDAGCGWVAVFGGFAAGVGALTKATMLVAPVQAAFFWIIAAGSWSAALKRWRPICLFGGVMLLVLTPWTLRNISVFGQPIAICTSGPLVFYSANNPESDGLYSDIPDRVRIETPAAMLAHMEWCNEQAKDFIRMQPLAFARLVGLKFLHTWGTETTYVELINRNGESIGWLDHALRFVIQVGWAALVFAWGCVAWWRMRYRVPTTPIELVCGIFVLSKFLIYSIYEGGARHHLPVVPLLIMYVAMCCRDDDTNGRCDSESRP